MKQLLRSLAITACVAFSFAGAQAQVITAERAQEIANSFFSNGKQKSAAVRSTAAVSMKKSADSRILTSESSSDAPTFHIITPASGEGFVIVAGEEIENPIIGYSFEGTIDTNDLPVGFVDYMTDIDAQVRALREYNANNPQKAAAARSAMQKTNYNATTMGEKVVLLETAKWGQSAPFNAQCWTTAAHTQQALTGCVPTAFAIIMRYHEWPIVGTGAIQDCQDAELPYTYYDNRTYDYSKMPLVYDSNWTEEQKNEVAKLMSHLGHAFGVSYGTGETSVTMGNSLTTATKKYFNYNDCSISNQYNNGSLADFTEWKNNLKNSLDNNCPVPYGANNIGSGTVDARHMFVVDGYTNDEYFHFNFGWNGGSNGWYKLDAITVGYSWSDDSNGYKSKHQAFFNLTPNKTKYPVTATVEPENAGTVTVNPAEQIEGGIVTLTAAANAGYTFQNWTKGGEVVSTNKSCTVKVASSDNDYVANFLTVGNTTVNVSVTYNSSYGTVTGTSGTVANGTTLTPRLNEEVTLTATPADGYIFTGWTVTKGTESTNHSGTSLTFVATGEMSVTANFALAVQDYVVNPQTGTLNNGTNRSSVWTYTTGGDFTAALSISATDSNGNVVNSITNKTSGTAGHYFAPSGIIANTETPSSSPTIYTISVPNGYKITGYAIKYYPENGSITLTNELGHNETATNSSNDYYLNASGLNVQSTTYTVAGTGRMTTLSFSVTVMKDDGTGSGTTPPATQYTITATANPGTAGSVTGGGTYNEGATVTLTATPNSGYEFVNWTKGGIEVSTNATYSFTANASAEYVANFEETEEELPITGTGLDITFNGATGFPNSGNTNQVQTATDPVITISSDGNNIGISTIDGVKHPYLFKNCSFTISVPEPYRIAGYKLTVTGHNFDQGTITYTAGAQLARSNTATATIEGTTPKTVIATGLNNSEININVGDASETLAGVIITALEIDYVEEAQATTEYSTPTGTTYTNNYLTSITTTGGDTNIGYSANAHPGQKLVVVPGKVQLEKGKSFTMSLIAKSLGAGSSSITREDMRYCHASLFTDFDQDFTFEASPVQTWGNKPPTNNVYGNYDYVMNITHTITVPDDAPTGESHIRMIYTSAWNNWPANGTAELDKGIVYDIVVEVVEKVDITANAGEGGSVTINGEATGTKRVIKGSSVTLNATPAGGYVFANWTNNLNTDVVTENPYTPTVAADVTYTANFAINTYTINVTAEGNGVASTNAATVEHGNSVTLTATPETNNEFTGWYNGEELVSTENPYTFTATSNINYTARFNEVATIPAVDLSGKYYRLKLKDTSVYMNISNTNENNGATSGITTTAKEINKNAQIFYFTKSNDGYKLQARTGYYIKCHAWNANANTTTAAEATELTFESTGNELEYLIKWDNKTEHDNGDERDDYFKVQTVNYSNYIFCDAAPAAAATWVLEEVTLHNVTVTAAGTDGTATVAVGNGEGTVSATVEQGTSVTLTATPADGYVFANWTNNLNTDVVTENPYTVTATADVTYTANFQEEAVTYTISVSANPVEGGTVTGGGTYDKGANATLTATPNANYNFVNWTKNGVEVGTDATMIIENITANAEYVANFNYTGSYVAITTNVETIGGGEGGTVTGGGNYANGGTVTLTATPSGTNYRFMGWYNDNNEQVSTDATFEFTATANAKYTAKFIKRVYVEIIQPDMINDLGQPDKGYGFAYTWIGSGTQYYTTVDYGTEVTINVLVYDHFNSDVEFAYWSIDNEKISQENPYTFTATEDRYEFLANFNLKAILAVESGDNGSAYIGSEGTTSKEVVTGNTYTISAKANSGYAFDYWAKISGTDETKVSSSAVYTFVLTASLNETVTYKAYFKEITELEDGKAYRIKGRMSDGSFRYIYRDGNQIKWKNSQDNTNNSIFIAQYDFTANDGSLNLISAIGDLGWNYEGDMGDTYVALKTTTGTVEGTFTLYNVQAVGTGSSYRSYDAYGDTENESGNMGYNTRATGVYKLVDSNGTTDFIFEEVPFEFNVGIANGSNAKLGTINLPFATTVHPSITAYAVTGSDENYAYVAPLTLEENILPANTPVLVEAEEAGTYGFAPAPASNTVYETGFAGTLGAKEIADEVNAYILSYKGAGTAIKLYKLASDDRTINANKAYYIDETGSSSAISFKFVGTTDIDGVESEDENAKGIYDLQGRKLSEITEPGIYIVDGKKIMVK